MAAHSGPLSVFDDAVAYVDPRSIKTYLLIDDSLLGTIGTPYGVYDMITGDIITQYDIAYAFDYNNIILGSDASLDTTNGLTIATRGVSFRLPITGANTYYDVSRFGGAFTVWFKTSTQFDTVGNYTGRGCLLSSGSLSDFSAYCLWLQNSPPYRIFGETTVNNQNYVNVSSAAAGGVWNNFTCTLSNSTATSYLNGEEIDVVSGLTGNVRIGNIGGYGFSSLRVGFSGSVGQHAIWDRALTEAEILEIYNNFKNQYL